MKGDVSRPFVGEAFIEVENLKRLVPEVDLKKVKVHVKFDEGDSDGLFSASLNYQMEARDGHGTEEGSLKVAMQLKKDGTWETTVKTENPLALTKHSTII